MIWESKYCIRVEVKLKFVDAAFAAAVDAVVAALAVPVCVVAAVEAKGYSY